MTKSYVNKAAAVVTALPGLIADRACAVRAIEWLGRHMPVRQRYVLTRDNRLRLRYLLPGTTCVLALGLTFIVSFSGSSRAVQVEEYSFLGRTAAVAPAAGGELDVTGRLQATHRRLQRYLGSDNGQDAAAAAVEPAAGVTVAAIQPRALPQPRERHMEIGKGDTLAAVLNRAGVGASEAYAAVEALKKEFDPRKIQPGQNVYVRLDPVSPDNSDDYRMTQMGIAVDSFKSVALKRNGDEFRAQIEEKPVERRVYARHAPIEVSLYGSASKAGIPNAAIAEMIRVMSWDIDFQRDIRRGDAVDVMYDQHETADGKGVRFGNVIFARLNINGKSTPVYRYETKDGIVDYFDESGSSIRRALMRTPVDGARVSSGYGMRKHPVLGYSRMHKGVDFAAPVGTPIFAAGDGVIEKIGRWGAYGNYVRIRHNGNIKTAYAHLNAFGKGLSNGSRVKQGQVIGYVGATGRVTGPHLHYEVMMNNEHINPNSVRLPTGTQLKGAELASFKLKTQEVNRQFAELLARGERIKVASAAHTMR